jgi:hypothetical protein
MLHLSWDDPAVGETVTLDGVVLNAGAIGTTFPVDPGEHIVQALAPGMESWQEQVAIEPGPSSRSVKIPRLSATPKPDDPPQPESIASTSAPEVKPPFEPALSPDAGPIKPSAPPLGVGARPLRNAGFVTGGIALAAVGIGTYFGARAFQTKSKAEGECTGAACSARGLELYDDTERFANMSTVGFAIGALGLATSIYLLTRPSPPAAATQSRVDVDVNVGARGWSGALRLRW